MKRSKGFYRAEEKAKHPQECLMHVAKVGNSETDNNTGLLKGWTNARRHHTLCARTQTSCTPEVLPTWTRAGKARIRTGTTLQFAISNQDSGQVVITKAYSA
ncbi:hypothetical protein TWF718_007076 [Orbilia javanica]|uniref:Uncharacterized protein n=1 Tax=Orbilia javanica TaxID=47235 RepID=A0AAN8RDK6_9PEZI